MACCRAAGRVAAFRSASICEGVGEAGWPNFWYAGRGEPCSLSTMVMRAERDCGRPLKRNVTVFGEPASSGRNKFQTAIIREPSLPRTMPDTAAVPVAGAGRVASIETEPSVSTRAICLARLKVASAAPPGSSVMFSGCCRAFSARHSAR